MNRKNIFLQAPHQKPFSALQVKLRVLVLDQEVLLSRERDEVRWVGVTGKLTVAQEGNNA
jgi:hypothetical protein